MNPFIPEEDKTGFEEFLTKQGLEPLGGSPRKAPQANRHSKVADIDKFLHDIDSQMDSVLEDTTNL